MTAALCMHVWAKPMGHPSTYFNKKTTEINTEMRN